MPPEPVCTEQNATNNSWKIIPPNSRWNQMRFNYILICSLQIYSQYLQMANRQIYKFRTHHLPRPLAHQPLQRRCYRYSWNRARGLPGPSQESATTPTVTALVFCFVFCCSRHKSGPQTSSASSPISEWKAEHDWIRVEVM